MAKAVKKAKSVSPKSPKTKPVPKVVKKPTKPAPKVAPKAAAKGPAKPLAKPAAKVAAKPLPKTVPAKPAAKLSPAKVVAAPAKAVAKPQLAKPVVAAKGAPAPVAKAPVAPAKSAAPAKVVVPTKVVAPAKTVAGAKPPVAATAKTSKKGGKKGQPVGPVVISAKPGQILLTPLKPSANGAAKPAVTAVAAPVAPPPPPEPKKKAPPVPVPLPPAPVTSDSKAKKNQAGLSTKELEFYRGLLLAKRRELVGDMTSMEREALRGAGGTLSNLPVHMADMGTDNYEQEFTLGLVEKDRQLLGEINRALAKVHNGTYGICEGTGKPISKARLEAQPWSKFSIEYVRTLELRNFRR